MDTPKSKPIAWKLALSALMFTMLIASAMLTGHISHKYSTLVLFQWAILRAGELVVVLGAPWLGAWGKARIPCSPSFLWQLRFTAAAVFLTETLSLFHYAPLPTTAVWIPIAGALLLAELVVASYTLAFRAVSLSPSLAPRARRVVWTGAFIPWLMSLALGFVLPPLWEGPVVILRPLVMALVGEQPAALPLAALACVVLGIHFASRHVPFHSLPLTPSTRPVSVSE